MKRSPGYIPSMRELGWTLKVRPAYQGRHHRTLRRTVRAWVRWHWARNVLVTIKRLDNTLRDLRAGAARVARKRPVLVPEPVVPVTPAVEPTPKFLRASADFTLWLARHGHPAITRHCAPGHRGLRSSSVWILT